MLIITSLVLITLDQQGTGAVSSVRSAAQDVISPLQDLADKAITPVDHFFDSLGRADQLRADNARLRRENADLKAQVAAGLAARQEVDAFRQIYDLSRVADYDGVVASVVDGSAGNFERSLQIDKGTDAGIATGMPVVVGTAGGALVGKVVAVSKTRATVQRLDDPQFGVVVYVLSPPDGSTAGLASGQADSTFLELNVTDASTRLKKGQFAITTGRAGSPFPGGLAVGTVVHDVDPSTASTERAELRPIVDLDKLTLVKVLKYQAPSQP